MKKYFILAAAAVVALAACSKNNIENSAPKEISYNAVTAKNQVTKAINDKTYYAPTDPSFGIWGLYQTMGWSTNHSSNVWIGSSASSATQISYNESAWRNASNTDYWPLTGKLVFMGYSPYMNCADSPVDIVASISVVEVSETQNVKLTFTDFSSSNGNFVTDLMWSDAVEANSNTENYDASGTGAATYNGVPVVFHHALSQIIVNAKTDKNYGTGNAGYVFTITGLTLHIDDVATLNVYDPVIDDTTPTVEWGEPATDASIAILKDAPTALTTSFVQQSNAVVVIPQDLATKRGDNDDKLSVTYQVVHNGVTSTKSVDINLNGGSDVTLSSLAANTKYNLNLTFSLSEIKYSPDVDDWTATSSSNYSVQN